MSEKKNTLRRDSHVSSIAWKRLLRVYNHSGQTHQSLADEVGCNRKTIQRLLAGETYRDMLVLLYDVASACGVTMDTLFDFSQELPVAPKTRVASIDRMLYSIYNSASIGHIEPYAPFVSKNYRMFRSVDEDVEDGSYAAHREGIDYKTELELNLRAAKHSNSNRVSRLRKCYIAGEQVIAIYDVTISHNEHRAAPRVLTFIDHLQLERPISEHMSNGRLIPKILKRHWAELKQH